MPHPAPIILRLTVAVSFLTTWFTVSATLGNAVVPESSFDTMDHVQTIIENRSHANPSVLTATDAISAELTSIKKSANSDPGVAQIESTVLSMTKAMAAPSCLAKDSSDKEICKAKTTKTDCEGLVDANGNKRCTLADTDGGTKDMVDRLKSATSSINTAVDTMLSGTKTDYGSAKVDLKALDEAIDISKKTISTSDLETIRTAATTWCAKKRALETATTDKQTAAETLTNKLNAPLGITDLKLSEVGPIGEGDCSQTNGNVETLTSCPAYSCSDDNLAQRIKEKIATGRAAYLTASWDKHNKDAAFVTATNENTAKKATFEDKVETTASTYHSMCVSDDTVHATAVNSFNANNANRASRYLSLGIIKCHINHMKIGQAYTFTTADLLKSTSSNSATSSTDCIANLKTAANIQAAMFPDASSNEDSSKVCPALNVYVQEVHDYGGFGFDKTDWDADVAKCNAAASVPVRPATKIVLSSSQVSQSSTWHDGGPARNQASNCLTAGSTDYHNGQCCHTGDGDPTYWLADLGSDQDVRKLVISGRSGSDNSFSRKISIKVWPASSGAPSSYDATGGTICATNQDYYSQVHKETACNTGTRGRYVMVNHDNNRFMVLCEIQIYG